MALEFPANPTVDDTYTYGGAEWRWTGTTWVTTALGAYGPEGPEGPASTVPGPPGPTIIWYWDADNSEFVQAPNGRFFISPVAESPYDNGFTPEFGDVWEQVG